jgi:hypothetical protein
MGIGQNGDYIPPRVHPRLSLDRGRADSLGQTRRDAARNRKGGKQEIQGALHLPNRSPTDSLNEGKEKGMDESKSESQGQGSGKPKPTCQRERDGMSVTAPPPPFSAGGAGQEKKPPGPPCGGCYLILGFVSHSQHDSGAISPD